MDYEVRAGRTLQNDRTKLKREKGTFYFLAIKFKKLGGGEGKHIKIIIIKKIFLDCFIYWRKQFRKKLILSINKEKNPKGKGETRFVGKQILA